MHVSPARPTTPARRGRRRTLTAILIASLLCAACAAAATPSAQATDTARTGAPPLQGTPGTTVRAVAPSVARGAWIAKLLRGADVRGAPGAGHVVAHVAPATMYVRAATRLLVTAARYDRRGALWLEVALPTRPTGARGWIAAAATRVDHTRWFIRISTARRELRAYAGGRLRLRVRAVVGAPATPTPRGLFAIYEKTAQADPSGFIGPWALHLTAFSNVLFEFGAGRGRVAIHGRGPAALGDPLGSARSHGCVRVENGVVQWLRTRVGAGTPVRIVR